MDADAGKRAKFINMLRKWQKHVLDWAGKTYQREIGAPEEERPKSHELRYDKVFWHIFGLIVALFGLYTLAMLSTACILGWQSDERGQFGDMFGGLNVLFSGFAFAAFIVALLMQHTELRHQRQEMKQTREEMQQQREVYQEQNRDMLTGILISGLTSRLQKLESAHVASERDVISRRARYAQMEEHGWTPDVDDMEDLQELDEDEERLKQGLRVIGPLQDDVESALSFVRKRLRELEVLPPDHQEINVGAR